MKDENKKPKGLAKLEPVFDILGEILAVFMVVCYIVALANAQWNFLASVPVIENILNIMLHYGALLLVAVVGLEAMVKRGPILRIIFYACLAIIVIFLFFPATYENLIGLIK